MLSRSPSMYTESTWPSLEQLCRRNISGLCEQETPDETSIFFRPFFFTSKNKTQRKNIQEHKQHKIDNPIRLFYRT